MSGLPKTSARAARIVFYDGHCALCNGTVRWLLRLDRREALSFAPLQGSTAAERLKSFERCSDSIIYWRDPADITEASEAIGRILGDLAWPWSWGRALLWLPRGLRDWGYDQIARRRYRVFGRYESCPLPPEEQRHRFLS